jgi:hypothetical protein
VTGYLPASSQSRYIFHSYEFDTGAELPVVQQVMPVYEALRKIYCRLTGDDIAFGEERDGWAFLPQCIRYPCGGGRFRAQDGSWVETKSRRDIGDVTLFRYDLGHDITPVDPEQPLDWSDNSGRWSMVLPLRPLPR